ncbi:DNA helicase RecQ [Sulfurimonas microaerophilic]|uniref:DNA helicase RecQ n=1 Tax=Sulfurimonas microaerophilic TaxID=3058392 RepID=UPI002714E58C|nr:DNA helicase RecQ [Sulfurimonas sp. hsl 1-7]
MKQQVLKEFFGHNSFRELQEEGVDAILNGRDLLMILPTGGGKSLVYQLPTMMMNGVTIVISPLIALMQDQVASLHAQDIPAAMFSSAQNFEEIEETIRDLYANKLKFLYLSPERLNNPHTLEILRNININFFVIDEAHCISQWGHEFRDDYRSLGQLKNNFPSTTIAAFTATSTNHVTEDILRELQLKNPLLLKGKIFRKNLFISAQRRISNGQAQLKNFLLNHENESGIIYVSSRKKAEDLSSQLNQAGYKTLPYHAGLPQHIREQNFKLFVNDRVNIMVATIAFGMGIDKADIRFVVHMSLPKSLENYYQEIGRAGRDGENSEVLLLFNAGDIMQHKRYLDEITDERYKEHLGEKIDTIYKYATSELCFHQQLASYFEDSIEECGDRCENCLSDDESRDITKEAQMLLSCIYKTEQTFGKNYIIDVLRGSTEQKLLANKADKLSVYGIGSQLSKKEWFVIVERLLELGIITLGEFQSLKLTNVAVNVLKSLQLVTIKASRLNVLEKQKAKKIEEEFDYDRELFEKLRDKRKELADELDVPAYIIFSDKTLKHLANEMPTNKEEMLEVNGIGLKKYTQYGEEFLEVINS